MASVFERGLKRFRKKDEDEFIAERAFDTLEMEGFRRLITTEMLEKRLAEMAKNFRQISEKLRKATSDQDMGEAIDDAHYLLFTVGSAWLRSMENKWLARKIGDYCEQYADVRDIPAFLDMLLVESKYLINLAFTNLDVQTIKPILIQSFGHQGLNPRVPWSETLGRRGRPPDDDKER